MKKKLAVLGVLVCVGIAMALPDAWFAQDFEGVKPGSYKTLHYSADGVDVALSGINGPFLIADNAFGGMLGERSLLASVGKDKTASVLIEFSAPVQGITVDILNHCDRLTLVPVINCFDAEGAVVLTLGGRSRPCNQLVRAGASIIGERIIVSCEASGGLFDNFIVEP